MYKKINFVDKKFSLLANLESNPPSEYRQNKTCSENISKKFFIVKSVAPTSQKSTLFLTIFDAQVCLLL